jgi:hypothetical protein
MVATHCRPSGSLGTNQIDVPSINSTLVRMDDSTHAPVSGKTRRGRILMLPGVGGSSLASPFWEPSPTGNLPSGNTFRSSLNSDGWQTVQCPNVPQTVPGEQNLVNDISADGGFGSRLVNTRSLYHDHIMDYCNRNFGGAMPTFVIGMSWGAWEACWLTLNRATGPWAILGAYAHCNVNAMKSCNPAFIVFDQTSPIDNTGVNYSGCNLSTTALNAVTLPMRVTWANSDAFITGGNGTTAPPTDAISMVSNACTALGGTVTGSGGSTVANGTWVPGSGMVTGLGQSEAHAWDQTTANTPDSNDCLNWFQGTNGVSGSAGIDSQYGILF